jgi:putative oxidoreductase
MKHLGLIGRIFFCFPLIGFGMGHLSNATQMITLVPNFMPFPIVWVYFTGLAMLAAAVSILIRKKMKLATLLLGIMLMLFAFLIWIPQMMSPDEIEKMNGMAIFFRDMGLAGGAFFISSTADN